MAVQVDYRIAPSDQFSVYNPDTKANKTITYFTLLAKIRGDLNISGSTGGGDISGSGSVNYLSKFDGEKSITISQLYDDGTYVGIGNTSPAHKLDVNGGVYADYFQLDTSYSDGAIAGKFSWNPDRETVELGLDGTVSLILGQDVLWYVKNQSGSPIPKGRAVRASGALGASSRITVEPMVADGSVSSKYLLGITIEEIENGGDGFVISQGKIRGINTSGYTVAGTVLYCDPSNAGQLTETEPTAPDLKLPIAFTVDKKNNGTLAVRITAGTTISEANDVQLTSIANNQFLRYNSTIGAWENQTVSVGTVTSVDITAGAKLSATGGPITTSGSITVAHIATEPADLPTMTSFISYVETNGGTVEAVGPVGQLLAELTGATVPTSTSNTGGTVLQNISIDDYGHVFGVSSVSLDTDDITEATNLYYTDARARAALSAGSGISYDSGTGTISNSDKGSSQDIFKTIAVSGQTDIVADSNSDTLTFVAGTNITITTDAANDTITINSPDAGGTVTSIGTSAPIQGGPITTSGTISITQSGTSTDGYLSSTDWNTFNNKEPALTKGDLTEATSSVLTISNGTGAVIGAGTSIEVTQSSASVSGYLSSTDWSTFNGKADNSFTTIAVSTQTDIVADSATDTLTFAAGSGVTIATDATNDTITISATGSGGTVTSVDLTAGTGISVSGGPITSSGSITVTNTAPDQTVVLTAGTGITTSGTYPNFTITNSAPDQTVTLTGAGTTSITGAYPSFTITSNDQYTGTVTSVDTSAPLSGGPITSSGTISITQSGTSTDGYLSSADWNTFSGKQDALTFGNLTEATSSILTITGGANAVIGAGTSIAVSQASGLTNGYLSSTDWTTFNGKQDALTFTSPLVNTSGTVTINQSGTATDGYLSSTDWNTFAGKASYAFKTISVSGQSDIVADAADDTLTIVEGGKIVLTTDATADSLTIAHGTADGVDIALATAFQSRVVADGGTFEAVWPVAAALGLLSGGVPSAVASNNVDGEVLQNIAVDVYGHVIGYSSIDLDDRYYTETEVDALFALETLDTVTGRGATTTNSITIGGLTVDTSTLVVDSANNRVVIGVTSASYPLHVKTQVSNVSIYADYDIAAYSDARVKEDVITISGALEKVRSMRGVTYKRIGLESDKRFMGVIAQEVLPHAPEVVHQDEDGMYSVSYQNMVGLLIEAMKEQQQQIDELKEQLNKYLK